MTIRSTLCAACGLLVLAAACAPGEGEGESAGEGEGEGEPDVVTPRVVSVVPGASPVRVASSFLVTFTEALDPTTVDAAPAAETLTVVLVPTVQVSETFLADFDNAPISETRQGLLTPIDLTLAGSALTITPAAPLEPRTGYTLLISRRVRDLAGNPLAAGAAVGFVFDFTTTGGHPTVVAADLDAVAPNRRRFDVTFSAPVLGVGVDALHFEPAVAVDAIVMDSTGTVATLLLADPGNGCERFSPSERYALVATSAISSEGEDLVPFTQPFVTLSACDLAPNIILDEPRPVVGETSAIIRFDTSKPSTTEVRFGLQGGALDCLGGPCPVRSGSSRSPTVGSSPPRYLHTASVDGLTVNVAYDFRVGAEDDVGSVAEANGVFSTSPLPRVAVNEVMANPPAAFIREALGEYVELANHGDVVVDLSGYALLFDGGADAGGCTAVVPDGAFALARGFVVIAGQDFDADVYAIGGDVTVLRLTSGGANGMCPLANSRASSVVLLDPGGRAVSSVGAFATLVPDQDGRSLERRAPDAADLDSSFCFSRFDVGPTPGEPNGVLLNGCE